MAGNQERQFRFGAIVHEDYRDLAMLLPELEDRLNQNIDLRDYTDRVERIYFAPIILADGENEYEEEVKFSNEDKQVFIKRSVKNSNKNGSNSLLAIKDSFVEAVRFLEVFPDSLVTAIKRNIYC